MAFKPLTGRDIEEGRMRNFRIVASTGHLDDAGDAFTTDIAAVSLARALRVLADRVENSEWKGPAFSYSPE